MALSHLPQGQRTLLFGPVQHTPGSFQVSLEGHSSKFFQVLKALWCEGFVSGVKGSLAGNVLGVKRLRRKRCQAKEKKPGYYL